MDQNKIFKNQLDFKDLQKENKSQISSHYKAKNNDIVEGKQFKVRNKYEFKNITDSNQKSYLDICQKYQLESTNCETHSNLKQTGNTFYKLCGLDLDGMKIKDIIQSKQGKYAVIIGNKPQFQIQQFQFDTQMSQRNRIESDSDIQQLSDYVDFTHQSLLKNNPKISNSPDSSHNLIDVDKFKNSFKRQDQHDSPIVCARFSADVEYSLFVCSMDGYISVWNESNHGFEFSIQTTYNFHYVVLLIIPLNINEYISLASDSIIRFSVKDEVKTLDRLNNISAITSVQFSEIEQKIYCTDVDNNVIEIKPQEVQERAVKDKKIKTKWEFDTKFKKLEAGGTFFGMNTPKIRSIVKASITTDQFQMQMDNDRIQVIKDQNDLDHFKQYKKIKDVHMNELAHLRIRQMQNDSILIMPNLSGEVRFYPLSIIENSETKKIMNDYLQLEDNGRKLIFFDEIVDLTHQTIEIQDNQLYIMQDDSGYVEWLIRI